MYVCMPARARRPKLAMGTAALGDGHGNRGGDGRADEHGYRGHNKSIATAIIEAGVVTAMALYKGP